MGKKIKNKYFLLLTFLIIFLFLCANSILALEVPLPGLGDNPTLPEYVIYFFKFGCIIAGIIALISFTVGAIGLINPNIEAHNDAKDRMKGAVLGLVLTVASFIIINTINPTLTTPTLNPLTPVVIPTPPPQPGVYYFTQPNCQGEGSDSKTISQDDLGTQFNGKIKSVKILNDPTNGIYYGVIFHKEKMLENGGECSEIIFSDGCQLVNNIDAHAADIFKINKNSYFGVGVSSGDGVTFYSEPYGWNTGSKAGYLQISNQNIISPYFTEEANMMNFDYTNVDRSDEYQKFCQTFQDCSGSIKIKGNYLVALYSTDVYGFGLNYCQTFTKDIPNLNAQPMIASGTADLDSIYIIPTQ